MEHKPVVIEDTHHRVHDYLRISITEHCNLRCTYCMPAEGVSLTPKSQLMTAEEIIEIAKQFVLLGVKKIRLTGGEPLVRKDIDVILNGLSTLGVELTLTTNGILIDQHLEAIQAAGIKSLNVSIDTLQKEKFHRITRRDEFDKLLSNLALLRNTNLITRFNVVLIKGFNDDEILDFIALSEYENIQVRFIEFMPFDGNKWDRSKVVTSDDILALVEQKYIGSELLRVIDKPNDTARNYKVEGFKGGFSIISSVSNPFCSTCNRIRLTADGKLKNCLFSNGETPLLEAFRAGQDIVPIILGNVKNKHAVRGGMDTVELFEDPMHFNQNRSMI